MTNTNNLKSRNLQYAIVAVFFLLLIAVAYGIYSLNHHTSDNYQLDLNTKHLSSKPEISSKVQD
jgi:hypothetical protein